MRFSKQFDQLVEKLPLSDTQKSSHWRHYTKNANIDRDRSISGISGFGANSRRSGLTNWMHAFFQRAILGIRNSSFSSGYYRKARLITANQNRSLDMDVMRHVCTFDLLEEFSVELKKTPVVCVIGDGQANFVSQAVHVSQYKKIISVNLTEILISDLQLLSSQESLDDDSVRVVDSKEELAICLEDSTTRLLLVSADCANILENASIDLFVNIASFQEMTPKLVDNYFELMQSNSAFLYCCNRVKKTLPDGEVLEFDKYPWKDAQVLLDEDCPWHQRFYTKRPPFIRRYDGNIRHRLAKFP